MRMADKIHRSRHHATAALAAYRSAHDFGSIADPDDVAAIGDLIVDLCHLADSHMREDDPLADHGPSVHGLVLMQLDHFDHERDPANADEQV